MSVDDSVVRVRFARNFQRNLDELEAFEHERDAPLAFAALLDELFDTLIPSLEQFPRLGTELLARPAGSAQAHLLRERLKALTGSDGDVLRQCALKQHVVLYLERERYMEREPEIVLLAIRHHRQLGFDFAAYWEGP